MLSLGHTSSLYYLQASSAETTSSPRTQYAIFHPLSTKTLLLLFICHQTVISAHLQSDFRCSHVPPAPEQVHHVLLDSVNFTTTISEIDSRQSADFAVVNEHVDDHQSRSRRHIESSPNNYHNAPSQAGDDSSSASRRGESLWELIRRLEPKLLSVAQRNSLMPLKRLDEHDDLVPMKIQVHYDASVHELEKKKVRSIIEYVIPAVVKYFEDVLLIRDAYTIDKFRMSRRCPNNTVYYAKDNVGLSRPYCMERCEDHAVCGEMIVPREHLSACSYCNLTSRRCTTNYSTEGKGVENTQLLLYVSAKQTVRCKKDQTIAYAAHCAQDAKTDRPVAGHANLCPSSISTDLKDIEALIATVKHELTHVLGFSVSLFAYYRDQYGQPLTERPFQSSDSIPGPIPVDPKTGYAKWSDKVIRKLVRPNWVTGDGSIEKEVHVVVTPTVVHEVRRHFNCSSLEGAELEDQGSDGTSMTHWEKRLFENEAMTGTHTQNSVYSRLTLAVLQDTGWYVANFSKADQLEWGKDLGCDFAKKSCKSWIDEKRAKRMSIRPFCDRIKGDLLQIGCTEDRKSKAVCNMRHYRKPLPGVYRNFDLLEDIHEHNLAHYGGSVDLADYCPFIQEFTWQVQNVTVRGSRCDIGDGTSIESDRNAALEHYGPESRCFEHGRRWEHRSCAFKRDWHHYGAGCYNYNCSNGHLNIHVGNHTYSCYYADQVIQIEQVVDQWLYNGSLICPPCDKICPASKCISYDKRMIDLILNIGGYANSTEETMRAIMDETLNGIDTHGSEMDNSVKSFEKYKSVIDDIITQSEHRRLNGPHRIRNNTVSVAYKSRHSLRHPLLCSGTSGHSKPSHSTLIISLIVVMILILRQTR